MLNIDRELKSLYRFQGGNSYHFYNISKNGCENTSFNYTYFSKSLDHHKYFIYKRLVQCIRNLTQKELKETISRYNLNNHDFYRRIQKFIINSPDFHDLESLTFQVHPEFLELITSNYERNTSKVTKNIIERVDRRVYGGGYGINDEWLKLFNALTFYYSKKQISTEDLLQLIRLIKEGLKSKTECIEFLNNKTPEILINHDIYNNFNKYKIMEYLEDILDKGLYKEGSTLASHPRETIKSLILSYSATRDDFLRELENKKIV